MSRRDARSGTRQASPAPAELATLTALAHALSGPAALQDSLEAALATVADALGLETGWVWLVDDDGEARLAASRALPAALREHPDAMHGDCYCLKTFRAGDLRGAANVNVVWCSRLAVLRDDEAEAIGRLQCHASVPLLVGDRRLGMLNVASRDWRVLSDAELSLLTTAGALVGLAVERSRLEAASTRAVAAEERNRLAREIHDTIAQGLAALTMQLEVADSLVEARPERDERLGAALGEPSHSPVRHSARHADQSSISVKPRSRAAPCARHSRTLPPKHAASAPTSTSPSSRTRKPTRRRWRRPS